MENKKKIIEQTERQTKINYLLQIGLFKESALREMQDRQINDLVDSAVSIKGF